MSVRYAATLRGDLGPGYLSRLLAGAVSYDRIAGYFRSSVLDIAGQALEGLSGHARILCNHAMDPGDVRVARSLRRALRNGEGLPLSERSRERYLRLHALLVSGKAEIRVLCDGRFLHAKSAVVRMADGGTVVLNGSVNETLSGWAENHEILTEDRSPEAADWMSRLFEEYWESARPLPEAVVEEMGRLARRREFPDIAAWRQALEEADGPVARERLAASALVEAPVFLDGDGLLPWQKGFVSIFLERRVEEGAARLLLADEVGLGKTLSLGACLRLSLLMGDGPGLAVVPAPLVEQWQAELLEHLGMRSMAWNSARGRWLDPDGEATSSCPASCPAGLGIVSSGLVVQDTAFKALLLRRRYGTVVLDESHKARCGPDGEPNNTLDFLRAVAPRTRNLLLASATPMQLRFAELHGLVEALSRGCPAVLGGPSSLWRRTDEVEEWMRRGWPAERPDFILRLLDDPRIPESPFRSLLERIPRHADGSPAVTRMETEDVLRLHREGAEALSEANPFLRHIVLRRRVDVARLVDEKTGQPWMRDIRVAPYPPPGLLRAGGARLDGQGAVLMGSELEEAYEAARAFTRARMSEARGRGFMSTVLLRRIGSSPAAGLATLRRMLLRAEVDCPDDEEEAGEALPDPAGMSQDCLDSAQWALGLLSEMGDLDPKGEVLEHHLEEMGWLGRGSIVFSQFLDTAMSVARRLSGKFPGEDVGVYAGAGKSRVLRGGEERVARRDDIRGRIAAGSLRLVVATDAACEGLNLQRLGTLVNYDLPWNPARLEQRLGRIRRMGQEREEVDLLNLRYAGSVEDRVFEVLGLRTQGIFDILAQMPDSLMDAEWIDALVSRGRNRFERFAADHEARREFLLREAERNPFIRKYGGRNLGMTTAGMREWERREQVLKPASVMAALSRAWPSMDGREEEMGEEG